MSDKEPVCPRCGRPSGIICDNDCGTYECERCNIDFHKIADGTVVEGHYIFCGKDQENDNKDFFDDAGYEN